MANLSVSIEPSGLCASIRVAGEGAIPIGDLQKVLRDAGVVHGIDDAALQSISKKRDSDEVEVVVARATSAVAGGASRVEHLFLPQSEGEQVAGLEDEHGAVDFREGHIVQHVEAGQLLARRVPIAATAGSTVLGEEIAIESAQSVKESPLIAGKNTAWNADKTEIRATAPGIPSLDKGTVSVFPGCTVARVDYESGNIHVIGSVVVKGDVLPGFRVHATENIEVGGTIEGGELIAGGKITVHGGVRSHSKLKALGEISIRFADSDSTVESFSTIKVRESATKSTLIAHKKLVVGRQLFGGTARAGDSVQLTHLGNEHETATVVEVVSPSTASPEAIKKAHAELAKLEAQLQDVKSRIARAQSGNEAQAGVVLKRLVPQQVTYELTVRERTLVLAGMEHPEPASGKIAVSGRIFPNVLVGIQELKHRTTERTANKTYRVVDGQLES